MKGTFRFFVTFCALLYSGFVSQVHAGDFVAFVRRTDSILSQRYWRTDVDTNYVIKPRIKFKITGRLNVSGARIKTEGIRNWQHFRVKLHADYKTTLSLAASYVGIAASVALNPAKLMGKYSDYETFIRSYGKRYGFDFIFQKAHTFSGWDDHEGLERINIPADMFKLRTFNVNAYYCFNHRKFSYPAAFTQSYIQRRSAGSFLLAISAQGQKGESESQSEYEMSVKMSHIGIGGGYGYNYVPARNWLIHLSALPTFIVYSNTYIKFEDSQIPLKYHFPEVIIAGRSSIVRQINNMFTGVEMVYNFTSIGYRESLTIQNAKWRARLFYGVRF